MKYLLGILLMFSGWSLSAQVQSLLIARNTGEKVLADGHIIRTMGFAQKLSENPGIPGPTLIYEEGDSVTIDLWNVSQGAPHTVHLHGLDVDQANDGVPHLSFAVNHMEHGYYRFKAPHPGTYLYHCHVVSSIHVQGGMYGLLIVKPKNQAQYAWSSGPRFHSEYPFLFSEIDTFWHTDSVLIHSHDSFHQMVEIPKYQPQYFLMNGLSDQQFQDNHGPLDLLKDSTVYLRLANIGFFGNRIVFPSTCQAVLISSDGRPLPLPLLLDTLVICPGERYGVLVQALQIVSDSITVEYFNLNNRTVHSKQLIKIQIRETSSIKTLNEASTFLIYPNPGTTDLNLVFQHLEKEAIEIHIIDLQGNTVHHERLISSSPNIKLNLSDALLPGSYIVQVSSKHWISRQKFVHL